MKKSTLLSFATAAAIVVTSAGTYAAWDKLSDTTENSVNLSYAKPVEVTPTIATTNKTLGPTDGINTEVNEFEVPITVNVTNLPADGTNKLQFKTVDVDGNDVTLIGFDVKYYSTPKDGQEAEITGDVAYSSDTVYTAKVKYAGIVDYDKSYQATLETYTDAFKVKVTLVHTN